MSVLIGYVVLLACAFGLAVRTCVSISIICHGLSIDNNYGRRHNLRTIGYILTVCDKYFRTCNQKTANQRSH